MVCACLCFLPRLGLLFNPLLIFVKTQFSISFVALCPYHLNWPLSLSYKNKYFPCSVFATCFSTSFLVTISFRYSFLFIQYIRIISRLLSYPEKRYPRKQSISDHYEPALVVYYPSLIFPKQTAGLRAVNNNKQTGFFLESPHDSKLNSCMIFKISINKVIASAIGKTHALLIFFLKENMWGTKVCTSCSSSA